MMQREDSSGDTDLVHRVVVNHEQHYSMPRTRELPPGCSDTQIGGNTEHGPSDVERIWTDMPPRTLRDSMDSSPHADGSLA